MLEFLKPLSFGQRLLLYRLVIAVGIAGMIYWAFYVPKSGDRAMHRAGLAIQNAKSWKVQWTETPLGGDFKISFLVEVSCPSSIRVTEHTMPDEGSRRQETTTVRMAVGGIAYAYDSGEKVWRLTSLGLVPYHRDCEFLSHGEDSVLLPPFHRFEQHGITSKGEAREVVGERCREWAVAIFYNTNSPIERYKVCLGVGDDLPRTYSGGGLEFSYFDWNVPINFTMPELSRGPQR